MAQRVLLASRTPTALQAVREGLQSIGLSITTAGDLDSVLKMARANLDLVVVSEDLEGGSGADVCAVLEGLPGHAPLLYVGDEEVVGADAVVGSNEPARVVLEQAMALLEGSALIQSLGTVQTSRDPEAVPTKPSAKAVAKSPDPPPKPAPGKKDRAFIEGLQRRVREADYFEILGVSVDASAEAVREAHASLRASLADAAAVVTRVQLEELQDALDEALDVLSEPALRAAYTRSRP